MPLRDLVLESGGLEEENLEGMGFGALRDPLSVEHMRGVNRAEAEFWRRSEGYRLRPSDELLHFDCGGHVSVV